MNKVYALIGLVLMLVGVAIMVCTSWCVLGYLAFFFGFMFAGANICDILVNNL